MRGSNKQASLSLSSFAFAIGLLALSSAVVFAGPTAQPRDGGEVVPTFTSTEADQTISIAASSPVAGDSAVLVFDAIEVNLLTAGLYQDLSAPPPPMPVPEIPLPPMLIPLAAGFLFVSRKVMAGKLPR